MVDNKQEPLYFSKHSADGKEKIFRISIFELNDSISFIFSNIFCGVSIQNIESFLVKMYDNILRQTSIIHKEIFVLVT